MKTINFAACLGLIFAIVIGLIGFEKDISEIENNILRLHIRANSNEESCQELKLLVRDEILKIGIFGSATSLENAQELAYSHKTSIEDMARSTIAENGHNYKVSVKIATAHFPTVEYENITLPKGNYLAVIVTIGEGAGDNWWCVMFPSKCVGSAAEVGLEDVLNERQVDIIENPNRYEFRLRSVEIFRGLRTRLSR